MASETKRDVMNKKITGICAAVVGLSIGGGAFAETKWAPPAEIAPKAAEAAPAAAPTAPAAPVSKQEKEKACAEQAVAKGLKGKAKKQFRADCLKA
jgi:hypothetical protein